MAILALAAGLPCTAGAESWTLMALVCADGDLSTIGPQYAQRLVMAAGDVEWSLALQLDNGDELPTRRLLRRGSEIRVEPPRTIGSEDMASARTLGDFFAWAAENAPADRYAVVVFGHGVSASGRGWDGSLVAPWPAVAIDAGAGGRPLRPRDLAAAIVEGTGRRADLVVLDSCYGASLEVAWDLRDATDLVIGSSGRLPSRGLPWEAMLQAEANSISPARIASGLIGAADEALALVRTDGLEELRDEIAVLTSVIGTEIAEAAPVITQARSHCATWGSEGEMIDVRSFCQELALRGPAAPREAARRAVEAIDRCVFMDGGPETAAVTLPFPAGLAQLPAVASDGFTETSGWGGMTRVYRDRLQTLMRRTFDAGRHDETAT
ncbi:MAG: clostripain-related cysteine peptidase [Armatimonadota bacterium]